MFPGSGRRSNPISRLHGGILCDLADAAVGIVFASTLEDGESFTTLELKINFLKPVWKARLRGEGRIVKRGKTVSLVECDVTDEAGSLVARASSTCLTLSGDKAAGRCSRDRSLAGAERREADRIELTPSPRTRKFRVLGGDR
ncbi:MAG: PaaI family thioesterase [Acidobacteria bacterium]|nr:PaaI family thioesterase [Acidobacteriota bacterium]